jgi:hypothetical protein
VAEVLLDYFADDTGRLIAADGSESFVEDSCGLIVGGRSVSAVGHSSGLVAGDNPGVCDSPGFAVAGGAAEKAD